MQQPGFDLFEPLCKLTFVFRVEMPVVSQHETQHRAPGKGFLVKEILALPAFIELVASYYGQRTPADILENARR